jgi:hypothetical protein
MSFWSRFLVFAKRQPKALRSQIVHWVKKRRRAEKKRSPRRRAARAAATDDLNALIRRCLAGLIEKTHFTVHSVVDAGNDICSKITSTIVSTAAGACDFAHGARPKRGSRNRLAGRRLGCETLELRQMLSVTPGAIITTIAGNYATGGSYGGDGGLAANAQLSNPSDVAVDAVGDIFIADTYNNVIREVNHATGVITTVAGNGDSGYSGDGGPATSAKLNSPAGVAVDAAGDIFIVDSGNNVIREVNHNTHLISTVAGIWNSDGYSGNGGPATSAQLDGPSAVAVDAAGDIFIADTGNNVIREVNASTGIISTIAGNGTAGYTGDGYAATSAKLNNPTGVAVDAVGDVFIADQDNDVIRKVDTSGDISTVAGNYDLGAGYTGDGGPATDAELQNPAGVAVDAAGDIFIADTGNNVVREVDHVTQDITTIAGDYDAGSGYSGDGGLASSAQLNGPLGVAVNSAGDLFIADAGNNVVREVTGLITTVAGNGTSGSGGDGEPASVAALNFPWASAGDVYIADYNNDVVREVNNATGVITTVAGNGETGYSGDGGPATDAELDGPAGVAVDSAGDIFIADLGNSKVREVNAATGIITTVAGNGDTGYSGDGGAATSAELNGPQGLAIDGQYLYIADTGNNVIRRVDLATGTITTVAGDHALGGAYAAGPAATSAGLN